MRLRRWVALGAGMAVLSAVSIAVAAWTSEAAGDAAAKARRSERVTVAAATGPAELYPGGPAVPVYFTVKNDNPFNILFTSMTSGGVTSDDEANCPATNVSAVASATGLSLASPAQSTTGTLSIPGVLTMSPSAPDGCQEVSFHVNLTLTGVQSGLWSAQSSGTSTQITDLEFVDQNNGFAAAQFSGLRVTRDGGASWTGSSPGIGVLGIDFIDPMTGWAVGYSGQIARTSNGGGTWTLQPSGTSEILNDVFFVSPMRGWAVGAGELILGTVDGGASWRVEYDGGASNHINAVHFTDPNNGFAVQSGGVYYRTTDGGLSWTRLVNGVNNRAVVFVDALNGWIGGFNGEVLRTTDGGATWTQTTWGASAHLWDLHFSTPTTGLAVGDSGIVRITTDGGSTWTPQPTVTTATLLAARSVSNNRLWAAGDGGAIISYR